MKEARFVSQNKEKWEKMEHVSHLDTDSIASNYVILSDDLSYAKTFYPGSDVVKYLNQLISVYQIPIEPLPAYTQHFTAKCNSSFLLAVFCF